MRKVLVQAATKGKRRPAQPGARRDVRVLSLKAPELAAAILAKQKRVENRSWPIPEDLKGQWVALHVSAVPRTPLWVTRYVVRAWDAVKARSGPGRWRFWNPADRASPSLPPRGAIVGLVRIRGLHRLRPGERTADRWALGPLCWEIERAVPLDPPICGVDGCLGFWKPERRLKPAAIARLRKAVEAADARPGLGRFVDAAPAPKKRRAR